MRWEVKILFYKGENMVIYETERLIIRKWEDSDCYDLYDYAKDIEVTKFLNFPPYESLQVAKDRIEKLKADYLSKEVEGDFAVELKSEKKVIGSISIVEYKEKNEGQVEIGYLLGTKYQGFGYMTEALVGMFKYIKANKIAKRITAKHDTENSKSGNVMKRAGMTYEGTLRKAGKNNLHSRYDIAIYSILDEEIEI